MTASDNDPAAQANTELQRLNAQIVRLNEQITAQPRLIAEAVARARRDSTGDQ